LGAADGGALTYTCVPPGEGNRLALDRDGDTLFDRDEIDAGTDPADPRDPFQTPRPTPTRTVPIATPTVTSTPTHTQRLLLPTPTATSLLTPSATPHSLPGDADCNGVVDAGDTAATATACSMRWPECAATRTATATEA
jgi:hypothetical protein